MSGTGTDGDTPEARDGTFVRSLDRGLAVIRAFGAEHRRLTLSQVAAGAGLPRAAARRFLLTLAELGYVGIDGREFSLAPRVLELGYAYLSSQPLSQVVQPHLEALVAEVNESSSVSVLDGDDVVYVARVPTTRIMSVTIAVGTRFPAYATSMGRVLLSGLGPTALEAYLDRVALRPLTAHTVADPGALRDELDRVRADGFSVVDQELEDGLRSAAAPLHAADGSVVAAVNVSVHSSRASMRQLTDEFVPRLVAAARRIDAELRHVVGGAT